MIVTIEPSKLNGALRAPDSKSHAHRLLIAAALSGASFSDGNPATDQMADQDQTRDATPGTVIISDASEDITATENCLKALLGQSISNQDLLCRGLQEGNLPVLDCGESGSTLRFLLPLSVTAGRGALFYGRGKLPERPLHPLDEELQKHGAVFCGGSDLDPQAAQQQAADPQAAHVASCSPFHPKDNPRQICRISLPEGISLKGGEYTLSGHISSQYVTGLLMALPLIKEDSSIRITTPLQSASYIHITLAVLRQFGINIDISEQKTADAAMPVYHIKGSQKYIFPGSVDTNEHPVSDPLKTETGTSPDSNVIAPEGDWSNGAFWLVANALGSDIAVSGLDPDSPQGDKAICDIIYKLTEDDPHHIITGSAPLIDDVADWRTIDAGDIPDLVPVISVLAALCPGETRIVNARRLRIKESDRLRTTCAMLTALGADISEKEDGLVIHGKDHLEGGQVDGAGDHRIVMAAAIAATCCTRPVTICDAQAAAKSYPAFFEHYRQLGGRITVK